MKKQRIIVILLIALVILCVSSTATLSDSKGGKDQFSVILVYDGALWPVTMNNESTEVFTSYSPSQNYVYEHYNDGTIINGQHFPFDFLISNNTKLYSGSTLSGTIYNWSYYDVIFNPNNIYYPGKSNSPTFLLSKSTNVRGNITYGYIAYTYIGQIGIRDKSYTFTLW